MKFNTQDRKDYSAFLTSEIAQTRVKVEKTTSPREQLILGHYLINCGRDLANL